MERFFYRYRPLKISGEKDVTLELENQELFLATLDENNDPMDGIQEIFWEGDDVLWKNFIKHYCLCLLRAVGFISLVGKKEIFLDFDMSLLLDSNIIDGGGGDLYNVFVEKCFIHKNLIGFLRILTARKKLYKEELIFLLTYFHRYFLQILNEVLGKNISFNFLSLLKEFPENEEINLESLINSSLHDFRKISKIFNDINEAIKLNQVYDTNCDSVENENFHKNILGLIPLFPHYYLKVCIQNLFPEYYLSSFSSVADNCSIWGKYAEGHKGICLMFEFTKQGDNLFIETEENKNLSLYEVKYEGAPPEINFFTNIGHLTMSALHKFWLSDDGKISIYASNYGDLFPAIYWDKYKEKISYKFNDWKYEFEWRAVQYSIFREKLPTEKRVRHYKFKHLKGIIFGMRTPEKTKLEIIKIIEKKTQNLSKNDFRFYQADFCYIEKKLEIKELSGIKINTKVEA